MKEYVNKVQTILEGYEEVFKGNSNEEQYHILYRKYKLASEIAVNIAIANLTFSKNYKYVGVGLKHILSDDCKYVKCTVLLVLFNNKNFAVRLNKCGFKVIDKLVKRK